MLEATNSQKDVQPPRHARSFCKRVDAVNFSGRPDFKTLEPLLALGGAVGYSGHDTSGETGGEVYADSGAQLDSGTDDIVGVKSSAD